MRHLTCEREGGKVDHQSTVFEICRWRTLKPQGNTGPKRPAKGNSPGEAAELPKRSYKCGNLAAAAAIQLTRGWDAPLQELSTKAFYCSCLCCFLSQHQICTPMLFYTTLLGVLCLCFDLLVHVASAGAPAWAMRLCQGIHVIFLPSFTRRSIVHVSAVF